MKISAIIPVAGEGKRFAGRVAKQFVKINGQPLLALTLRTIISVREIREGVVVATEHEIERTLQILGHLAGFKEKFKIVAGGKERQDSVYNGLITIDPNSDIVVVHDGVRPLVTAEIITASIKAASETGACVVAVPVKDTIKRVVDNKVVETLSREQLWQVQTPQAFKYQILIAAHQRARKEKWYATDEAALVERAGYPVSVIRGEYSNIKITTFDDLKIAQMLLNREDVL
jgi:2-C-methyl-D-erythritol 4-phosphate cytidylyltransferase